MDKPFVHLTSSEIAGLWITYQNDSMSKCILSYMLHHLEDTEIRPVIQTALDISLKHLDYLNNLFTMEKIAIPVAFNDNDVNLNAPRLYTDSFCLTYVNHMAKAGMLAHSGTLSLSARSDIREFFSNALHQTTDLFNMSSEVLLNKGIFVRSPFIDVPNEPDFVDSKKYWSGLNPFSEKRSLNAVELSHLYLNIQTNAIGVLICLSFAQTAPSKEIQEFMLRGKEISKKHIEIFSKILMENDIQAPAASGIGITDSTTQVFSEKLMMFQMSLLSASGSGNYATAAAASLRTDLILNYDRFSVEIAKYAKSGADIMIKHNWMEQPPGTQNKEDRSDKE